MALVPREYVDADGGTWSLRGEAKALPVTRVRRLLRDAGVSVVLEGGERPEPVGAVERAQLLRHVRQLSEDESRGIFGVEYRRGDRSLLVIFDYC